MDDDKPLARLLVANDDSDITQVFKLGLKKIDSKLVHLPIPKKHFKASHQMTSNAKSYCLVLSDIRIPNCLEDR